MKCPSCGKEIKDKIRFCPACGARTNASISEIQDTQFTTSSNKAITSDTSQQPVSNPTKKPKKKGRVFLIAIVVVLAMVYYLFVIFVLDSPFEDNTSSADSVEAVIQEYIDNGQYNEALDYIEANCSDESFKFYGYRCNVYEAQNDYDSAAKEVLKYIDSMDTYSHVALDAEKLLKSYDGKIKDDQLANTVNNTLIQVRSAKDDFNKEMRSYTKQLSEVNLDEDDYKKIYNWIDEHNNENSVKEKEEKYIKKIANEDEYFYVLQKYLKDKTANFSEVYYKPRLIGCCLALYEYIWHPSPKYTDECSDIWEYSNAMDDAYLSMTSIRNKYPLDKDSEILYGVFYVAQRLEKSYSDNIVGRIQKEIDSYTPENTSDWVIYDDDMDCYVLHADYLNPFDEAGNYHFNYVITDNTIELKDEKGFNKTVKILFLIPNEDEGKKALVDLKELTPKYLSNLEGLQKYLSDK